MTATQKDSTATANNKRKFRSPNRVLARSFRLARDKWKQKYMELRANLKSARQLATERGTSRDLWRAEYDAANQRAIQAEALAQQRLDKLEQLRSEHQELKKNTNLAGNLDLEDAPPARGSTPVGIIQSCIQFVVSANVSMRSVPRLFGILYGTLEPHSAVPEASSVRWWLLRLGLYALREPLPQADDWIYIIDHSVQIGTVKVCLILGIRLSDLPYPQRALRHEDMRVIDVIPVQTSTGEIVAAQLEQASLRTGIPRQIVSDGGSDVKKGAKLFAHAHPQTAVTYDAAHHGAIVLKRCFENDPKWKYFIGQLGQVKASIQQTLDAFLISPSLRPKARYMNLKSLLKWSRKILKLLDCGSAGGRASERAEARYGWLRAYRESIERWSRWEATVGTSVAFVRTRGLSQGCESALQLELEQLPSESYDEGLAKLLLEFVRESSSQAHVGDLLVGSSEVLESVFGKWKTVEHQESKSGITSLVLSLGTLLGPWPASRVKEALEATPVKHVVSWCQKFLPQSVQSQRQAAFADDKA